ncbi:RICIN domain-containing protein [Carboxylicivirga linearis]|uniref:RICIN domain-containing protein n=1 Tax=Carboxylicivirga linearis TaxID=1628157 RepID=A0ABS5JU72_9BACT|nr:RICIN domain-containing protein [Carboxylicivirga linearis]MBS2098459.1 RICIN domain-containing protein [Carboxylicivirga linearis]
MRKGILLLMILLSGSSINELSAQTTENVASSSDFIVPVIGGDRKVVYDLSDPGVEMPIIWGLDLAWLDGNNIIRGSRFMGKENVHVVRSSFMPTDPIVNGALTGDALTNTNLRINIINDNLLPETKVVLNSDHPSIGDDFDPSNPDRTANWMELIDITRQMHVDAGREVITVSPFNEPDYSATGQGTIDDFLALAAALKGNANFNGVRISGGNTLNCDEALPWFNYLKANLDEGNTHQLAGIFNNYAAFYEAVRTSGQHATNDELHNVMEAMVGVEYGMQTGIWWGWAEYARGEFCKASDGVRLGYAEHRDNWTAASVYRAPDGKIQAFGGTSERQAVNTSYRFVSEDRDVYYNGHGPQREYIMDLPGGTGYQQGQTNAETVVNITYGDDIQPVINGRYVFVNRNSGKVMEVAGGSTTAGANVQQGTYSGASYQQWNVTPVDTRIGGDFSYFTITAVHSGKSPDIQNWSLNNGGNIIAWDDTKSGNQQWYLDYAGDGWFYIRSRHSSYCLDVYNSATYNGANIDQWEKNGGANQQWRLLPVDATIEFNAPAAPTEVTATANAASIRLDWTASADEDVVGYTIYRSQISGEDYNTIARNVTTNAFVDNTTEEGVTYYYTIRANDYSLNRSEYSTEVNAVVSGQNDLVAQLLFDDETKDNTIHLNHGVSYNQASYVEGKNGNAISLNGQDDFLQLSSNIASHNEITIATWVYWNGGARWQPIVEFGLNDTQYLTLSPRLRFAIANGGSEQRMEASVIPQAEWVHLAVTLSDNGAVMYMNGEVVAESTDLTIRPSDFNPAFNYIGRSQNSITLFNGYVDDFRVYNYSLSATEIADIIDQATDIQTPDKGGDAAITVWPNPVSDVLSINYSQDSKHLVQGISLYSINGSLIKKYDITSNQINVADVPNGIYMLKIKTESDTLIKKIIIQH